MHRPVFTIALIAAGLVPALHAEDAIKASLGGQIQVRGEYANTYQENVGSYSPAEATAGKSDLFNFHLRRARFGAKFESANKQWNGAFVLRADDADKVGGNTNRNPALHQVFFSRNFANPEATVKYSVQAGLDYAFFNRADYGPSGAALLANQRATHSIFAQRGTGVGFRLNTKTVKWGVDIQNNAGDSASGSQFEKEGLWTSTRLELSMPEESGWNIDKYQETWGGAEGKGFLLGIDLGWNNNDLTGNTTVRNDVGANLGKGNLAGGAGATTYTGDTQASSGVVGVEALFRLNGLVVLAETRWAKTMTEFKSYNSAANTNFSGQSAKWEQSQVIYILQAGYAVPSDFISEGSSLEVAGRWTYRDASRENRFEAGAFGAADYGASGQQIDFGLNYYDYIDMAKDGKGNKTSLVYTNWHSEGGPSKAHIFRLQHQVSF